MNTKKRSTSLKDIASMLGVSIATVSRALQDNHAISQEMRNKAMALAKELDYRPNFLARSLRNDSIPVIGVIVPHGVTLFYSSVIDGIETYAAQAGYSVISMNSHESYEEERFDLESLADLHVAGIIASVTQETTDYGHFDNLTKRQIPIVFVARDLPGNKFSSVTADSSDAAYKATIHLIDNGCKRIALLGGPNNLEMVKERKHGYLDALHYKHFNIEPELVECHTLDVDRAIESTNKLLSLPNPPDGILALNDTLVFAAMKAIKMRGLRIPEDVALIGFTDVDYAEVVTPQLSAIMDQSHLMGETACKILLDHIGGNNKIQKKTIPTILKVRGSSLHNKALKK